MVKLMNFNNVEDLERYLNSSLVNALQNDVYETVKEVQQKNIQAEVYDKYHINEDGELTEPFYYKRRYKDGGLISDENIVPVITSDNNQVELIVENRTKGAQRKNDFDNSSGNLNGEYIAELIEYGDGYNGLEYDYKNNRDNTGWQYLRPRPFIEKTVEELQRTNLHTKALKRALKKSGIDIK